MKISREIFDQQHRPQFGNANPEGMDLAFWEWMIRGAQEPSTDGEGPLEEVGLVMRGGMLKSGFGPYRARDLFNIPVSREEGPVWTFERMGATRSPLPAGESFASRENMMTFTTQISISATTSSSWDRPVKLRLWSSERRLSAHRLPHGYPRLRSSGDYRQTRLQERASSGLHPSLLSQSLRLSHLRGQDLGRDAELDI
jgi:hypothetical protein